MQLLFIIGFSINWVATAFGAEVTDQPDGPLVGLLSKGNFFCGRSDNPKNPNPKVADPAQDIYNAVNNAKIWNHNPTTLKNLIDSVGKPWEENIKKICPEGVNGVAPYLSPASSTQIQAYAYTDMSKHPDKKLTDVVPDKFCALTYQVNTASNPNPNVEYKNILKFCK